MFIAFPVLEAGTEAGGGGGGGGGGGPPQLGTTPVASAGTAPVAATRPSVAAAMIFNRTDDISGILQ
jgi:hypothetical protein